MLECIFSKMLLYIWALTAELEGRILSTCSVHKQTLGSWGGGPAVLQDTSAGAEKQVPWHTGDMERHRPWVFTSGEPRPAVRISINILWKVSGVGCCSCKICTSSSPQAPCPFLLGLHFPQHSWCTCFRVQHILNSAWAFGKAALLDCLLTNAF